ncbi:MAG TPA: ATP-binding protein [Myxococcota bacterium]|nr:ATP-binding protein [Myxococcota bacterium]
MAGPKAGEERILILAPIGRDAAAIGDVLRRAGLQGVVCPDLPALLDSLRAGAGAAMVAEEALFGRGSTSLVEWVEAQPPWSDLPFIVLTSKQARPEVPVWRKSLLAKLRNASLLERPLDALGLSSAAESAVRSRRRQYEVQAYLSERALAAETLKRLVAERTSELEAANAALRLEMEQRRETEEALRQSQKMEAVGQLTGGLAHDFNNLLTAIVGSLEMIKVRVAQGRSCELERFLSAAHEGAMRAAALTHRLLAFSRRQTLDPRPTDLNRLVAGMEELIRRTVGPAIDVEVIAEPDLWASLVDQNQMENALLNLCINARDAMPDGGRLTIETANTTFDDRVARERAVIVGDYVVLCVRDTGVGMGPDVIAHAFDPFYTTKPMGQGTGLGLSMVYGFARQSGGFARIESEVGRGAAVNVHLPRHVGGSASADVEPVLDAVPPLQAGATVLVVEDEPMIRMLLVESLREQGFTAVEAEDGASALSVLRSIALVDVLVTDVGLPGGVNGRQVAEAARAERPNLEILFITGYAESAVVSGHLPSRMHVMTKPFVPEALVDRIRGLMSAQRAIIRRVRPGT